MPQEIDKILKKYDEEVKRYIDVLRADCDKKFQLLFEKGNSILQKLDAFDKKKEELLKIKQKELKTYLYLYLSN